MMEENKGLVSDINVLMANEEKANKKYEENTQEFQALEKADIMIRNDLKQNITKIRKS